MRILALVSDAFGGHGGIAKFNRDFLTALCSHPQSTEVVAIPRIISADLEPLSEKLSYVKEAANHKFKYLLAVFNKVKKSPHFDLIICGHIYLLPVAVVIQWVIHAPIILILHGIDAWQSTSRILVDLFIKKIQAFIAVSEFTKKKFLAWSNLHEDCGFVLPNCVDIKLYGTGPKRKQLILQYGLENKTVIMTLGRLASVDRYKGFDEVLELMPELAKEVPNIVYLIAGDGEDRKRLEEKARQLEVSNRVIFTGFVSESEKVDYYRLADCFVMPGRGEGFGIVYLEAMACGIPVVASKADGSQEAVRNGELGILVDPASPEEIKKGILEALKRPKGVIPEGLDYFSCDNFEKRVHTIIDKIVSKTEITV